ncbi:hypothetical protein REISMN_08405 (plasmid) [Rickettsia tamurae subsp. buchneri]|uniref:Uncharacterized protein n=1 Tax=Rickettsia tamurae subsp. buchneri TaxID=1462938 RepID=A0A8E1BZA8_9RICK|nr:hypothetical protein REISMN_08405 [Rickettsia tamurae subsp. buchneri]
MEKSYLHKKSDRSRFHFITPQLIAEGCLVAYAIRSENPALADEMLGFKPAFLNVIYTFACWCVILFPDIFAIN